MREIFERLEKNDNFLRFLIEGDCTTVTIPQGEIEYELDAECPLEGNDVYDLTWEIFVEEDDEVINLSCDLLVWTSVMVLFTEFPKKCSYNENFIMQHYSNLDEEAICYFSYTEANVGDVATAEWYGPNGDLYLKQTQE